MTDDRIARLRALIRDVPDFPKPGIVFKDITPLLASHEGFVTCLDLIQERYANDRPDIVVGVESRGFIFGAALAARTGASFVPVRKPGKLPAATDRVEYELEYGKDCIEMHKDAIPRGQKVLVVDDVIATGGTAAAACELVRRQGGTLVGAAFVIELTFLDGRKRLTPIEPYAILTY